MRHVIYSAADHVRLDAIALPRFCSRLAGDMIRQMSALCGIHKIAAMCVPARCRSADTAFYGKTLAQPPLMQPSLANTLPFLIKHCGSYFCLTCVNRTTLSPQTRRPLASGET